MEKRTCEADELRTRGGAQELQDLDEQLLESLAFSVRSVTFHVENDDNTRMGSESERAARGRESEREGEMGQGGRERREEGGSDRATERKRDRQSDRKIKRQQDRKTERDRERQTER